MSELQLSTDSHGRTTLEGEWGGLDVKVVSTLNREREQFTHALVLTDRSAVAAFGDRAIVGTFGLRETLANRTSPAYKGQMAGFPVMVRRDYVDGNWNLYIGTPADSVKLRLSKFLKSAEGIHA